MPVVWHGTELEARELAIALQRYCSCRVEVGGPTVACAGHAAYERDQRFLDGLVFARRAAAILRREELRA